jgi:hypothetical protein
MPIGPYKDFDDCVRKNSDKKNPKAYCGSIQKKVEEGMGQIREIIDVSEAEFHKDEETGRMTARVALIKAGRAKGKNRDYTSAAVRKAAKEGVYDNLRMFVNHSDKPPTKRQTMEMVSAVESTEYDPKRDAVVGNVEFFSEPFFSFVQRAKKYMGVSADHRIGVTYTQEGRETIEKVNEIVHARSVDWVVFPAAGGEILEFVKESEGAEDVEWSDVTLEQLKEHAPKLLEEYKTEISAKESEEDDDDGKAPKKDAQESQAVSLTKEDVQRLVQEGITEGLKTHNENAKKKEDALKAVREYVGKAGLPPRTRDRVINSFAGISEYNEDDVKEAVEDAKEEIKELKTGPRVHGMGGTSTGSDSAPEQKTVRESVEDFFIPKQKNATENASSGKES